MIYIPFFMQQVLGYLPDAPVICINGFAVNIFRFIGYIIKD